MGRRSKYEKFKPEVFWMISEGFSQADIRQFFKDKYDAAISKGTLHGWVQEYETTKPNVKPPQANDYEPDTSTPRERMQRVTPDPDSPLDRIIRAMWDVHDDPCADGAYTKLQALNALLKAEQYRNQVYAPIEKEDHEVTITVKREVVVSEN